MLCGLASPTTTAVLLSAHWRTAPTILCLYKYILGRVLCTTYLHRTNMLEFQARRYPLIRRPSRSSIRLAGIVLDLDQDPIKPPCVRSTESRYCMYKYTDTPSDNSIRTTTRISSISTEHAVQSILLFPALCGISSHRRRPPLIRKRRTSQQTLCIDDLFLKGEEFRGSEPEPGCPRYAVHRIAILRRTATHDRIIVESQPRGLLPGHALLVAVAACHTRWTAGGPRQASSTTTYIVNHSLSRRQLEISARCVRIEQPRARNPPQSASQRIRDKQNRLMSVDATLCFRASLDPRGSTLGKKSHQRVLGRRPDRAQCAQKPSRPNQRSCTSPQLSLHTSPGGSCLFACLIRLPPPARRLRWDRHRRLSNPVHQASKETCRCANRAVVAHGQLRVRRFQAGMDVRESLLMPLPDHLNRNRTSPARPPNVLQFPPSLAPVIIEQPHQSPASLASRSLELVPEPTPSLLGQRVTSLAPRAVGLLAVPPSFPIYIFETRPRVTFLQNSRQ